MDEKALQNAQALIKALSSRIRNLESPLRGFTSYLAGETRKQFSRGTDPTGKPWQPLSPKYLSEKTRRGYPATPLTRSGDMQKTIYARALSHDTAEFGLSSSIAQIHQQGSKKLPKREIVGLTPQRLARLRSSINTYLEGGQNASSNRP